MRLLAATRHTQGDQVWDKFTCTEGELLRPNVCPRGYDQCSRCHRLFAGLASHGVTTTAQLVEVDLTDTQLADIVRDYSPPDTDDDTIRALAADLRWPAEQPELTLGTVVGRSFDRLTIRA